MKRKSPNTYKTKWNFKLFYTSENDPAIEEDMLNATKQIEKFEKKWKNSDIYVKDETSLLKILKEYEFLINCVELQKPTAYFFYKSNINSNDKVSQAKVTQFQSQLTQLQNKIVFFFITLGKISTEMQKKIIDDSRFGNYLYFLNQIWKNAKFDLSESEEKIINLLEEPAREMWIRGFDKLLSNQKVDFKNKLIPIAEALSLISGLDHVDRITLQNNINKTLMSVSDFAESEINAVYTKKKIEDELRGYKNPYDATILRYQNDEKTVLNLVQTITNNFKISHKFYTLKAKILGLKKLDYGARGVSIGKIEKQYTFVDACSILNSSFEKVSPKYKEMFERFLKNGQIDVFPNVGKTGGAYCSHVHGLPTLVLHNYIDTYNSVNTLAHEMGHAFHSELSKAQPVLYEDYTMSVAETASTLFENFVFDEIFETLNNKEKIIALHDKIGSSISTVFRQIACFNFEKELHTKVRADGFVSKEEMTLLMNKHMKSYLGPAFSLTHEDGFFFVNWSHIRNFFYVYSYAYGELISSVLYEKYKEDKNFIFKIEEFLSAGGSKSPYQIFKDIGIDTQDPEFFSDGLKKIERDIKTLEKLVFKNKDLFKK